MEIIGARFTATRVDNVTYIRLTGLNRFAALLSVCLLASCAKDVNTLNGCTIGAAAGGLIGGVGGYFATRTSSPVLVKYGVPVVLGGAGAWLGSKIGCALDQLDRQKAADAVAITAMSGKPQTWSSASEAGVSGQTKVVSKEGQCRTVDQTVTLADGSQQSEQVKACKNGNSWEIVSS